MRQNRHCQIYLQILYIEKNFMTTNLTASKHVTNNLWLRALMQSDCLYSSLFFEHYNRILLCD